MQKRINPEEIKRLIRKAQANRSIRKEITENKIVNIRRLSALPPTPENIKIMRASMENVRMVLGHAFGSGKIKPLQDYIRTLNRTAVSGKELAVVTTLAGAIERWPHRDAIMIIKTVSTLNEIEDWHAAHRLRIRKSRGG